MAAMVAAATCTSRCPAPMAARCWTSTAHTIRRVRSRTMRRVRCRRRGTALTWRSRPVRKRTRRLVDPTSTGETLMLKACLTGRRVLPLLLLALAALAFNGAALAKETQKTASPSGPAAVEPPGPLLWKVSSGERSVYLLGSIHLLKPDDYPLSPDVDMAFEDSDAVVFEIPPAEMQSPELGVKMGQAGMRTDGTTLDSALPAETVAALQAWT